MGLFSSLNNTLNPFKIVKDIRTLGADTSAAKTGTTLDLLKLNKKLQSGQGVYSPATAPTPQLVGKPASTNATATPKPTTYGNAAATSPRENYINSQTGNAQVDSSGQPFGFMNDAKPNTTTTPTPSPIPTPDPYGSYKTAAENYFSSLNPSDATSKAKKSYLDYITNANLGIKGLEGQGRGIPLGLVRGQQEKLYNQSQIEAQRLQGDIDIASGEDTSKQNAALARMQYEQGLLKNNTPVSVSPGASLVDPTTGKVVYQAPFKPESENLPASAQEFEYLKSLSPEGQAAYTAYQNADANRKRAITNISMGGTGLTSTQANLFNNIASKYEASPLRQAENRLPILENTIQEIKKDPKNAALQLNLSYSYIQALDTYQSAVREGELGLVSSIDSKIGNLAKSIDQIQNGQIVRPEVAIQIANAAQNIVSTIKSAASSNAQNYAARASTLGLGNEWGMTYPNQQANNQMLNTGGGEVVVKNGISFRKNPDGSYTQLN